MGMEGVNLTSEFAPVRLDWTVGGEIAHCYVAVAPWPECLPYPGAVPIGLRVNGAGHVTGVLDYSRLPETDDYEALRLPNGRVLEWDTDDPPTLAELDRYVPGLVHVAVSCREIIAERGTRAHELLERGEI